jgi:DNA polymerase I-like protein with 3'-5' exonuclease and polymerase domains
MRIKSLIDNKLSGADMTKYALHLCRKKINENNLPVKLVMTVHDQIDSIAHHEYAVTWRDQMKEIMEQAALLTIPSGLLKANVGISNFWEK